MKTRVLTAIVVISAGLVAGELLSRTLAAWNTRTAIAKYLRSHRICKLQIGAGKVNLPGWLNTDIEPGPGQAYLDATKPFPLPHRSIDYIFGEHVIEHLSYDDGLAMLRQCYRVLRPGGKVRFSTPDLRRITGLLDTLQRDDASRIYVDSKFSFHKWEPRPSAAVAAFIINEELHNWGHRFVYDELALRDSLARAGFVSIMRGTPGTSDDPELVGIEARHKDPRSRPMNDYESMVLEGSRPTNR